MPLFDHQRGHDASVRRPLNRPEILGLLTEVQISVTFPEWAIDFTA